MASFGAMWWAARHPPVDPAHLSFAGKTVLVIGANSGLGHAAATKYAALGASHLILGVRTVEKGERAKEDIARTTGCSPDIFTIQTLDLASFASVRAFCERIIAQVSALHILQLTGGVMAPAYVRTGDGYESTVEVNVLSPALIALLLIPKMRATGPPPDGTLPHISFLNSVAHLEVKASDVPPGQSLIQRLNDESHFHMVNHYFPSKLAAWFAIRGIAERCKNPDTGAPDIVVNGTCSGVCKTNMITDPQRGFLFAVRAMLYLQYALVGRTAEQGARTLVGATGLGPESHGKFWINDQYMGPSELESSARGDELYQETWDEILSILS
ncbi:NAD(P)-binding protein [Thozetella sp. PMI_491]|nr:NAD(P)-binding protein [Thozetella sp. PMI_491]